MNLADHLDAVQVYPWQRELADKIVEATKNGERLVLRMYGRKGGMVWVREEVERRLSTSE